MIPLNQNRWGRDGIITALIALSYVLAGQISAKLLSLGVEASPLWPSAGIALGFLLVFGSRFGLGVGLGSLCLGLSLGASWQVAIGPAIASTLQAIWGVRLLEHSGFRLSLTRLKDVYGFILLGVILSPLLGATLSTLAGCLNGSVEWSEWQRNWWTLWLGDGMGILIVTPLLTLGQRKRLTFGFALPQARTPLSVLGSSPGVFFLLTALVGWGVFGCKISPTVAEYPLEYLPFPLLVRAALRFGQPGAVLSNFLISSLAIWGTVNGNGPFIAKAHSLTEVVLFLQAFMGVMTITALMLAAAVAERDAAENLLRQANLSLEQQVKERTLALQDKMQELNQSNQLKDVFLEAVSHNLRTTVMGNLMLLQTLLKKPGEVIQIPRSVLEQMRQASDRQLTKLNLLKEITDFETQGIALACHPIDFKALIDALVKDWEPRFQESQATLRVDLPAHLPLLNADPDQVQTVLAHLLGNALKHNPPGVQVILGVQVMDQFGKTWVRCSLTDDGAGIAPQRCDRLFELYVADSPQERLLGCSLGLYLCRQIVEAHGGQIGVESDFGQGSQFWFTLPVVSRPFAVDPLAVDQGWRSPEG